MTKPRGHYIRVIEYRRIRSRDLAFVLDDPGKVADAARQIGVFKDDGKERFGAFLLDNNSQIIGFHHVSTGSGDASVVSPREVFGPALRELGTSRLILVHDHPSGDPRASQSDITLTRELCKAGRLLSIE